MTKDKAFALVALLGFAWLCAAVMTVVTLVDALRNSDRWSGFVILLSVTVAITGLLVLVYTASRRNRS